VQVLTRQVGERLEIAVRDSGPGIPEAEHGKVFERFARLTPRPTAHEKTAGLGLSLAKALVELHEGTVGFESRPGGGSRFWLRIPRPAPGRRTE
jgi:signal transduction histidine kinase